MVTEENGAPVQEQNQGNSNEVANDRPWNPAAAPVKNYPTVDDEAAKDSMTHREVPVNYDLKAGMAAPSSSNAGPTLDLTYGEKLVGITFNPGGSPEVNACKQMAANMIDQLDSKMRSQEHTGEQIAHFKLAIREIQSAQMWAVKALTLPAI